MSVIVKASDVPMYQVFCKGSPETIINLSKSHSVPNNIISRLDDFTGQGYRVIAMATKVLTETKQNEAENLNRDQVESDLEFLGLIVLENKLKPVTSGVIYTLKTANMNVVMITGKANLL